MRKAGVHKTPLTYRLRGLIGDRERCFVLAAGESTLGSSGENDVVIPAPGVSRRHARLDLGSRGVSLEDLGSRNGTWVAGQRVRRRVLEPGDAVRFGPVEMVFESIDPRDAELAVVFETPALPSPAAPSEETTCPLRAAGGQGAPLDAVAGFSEAVSLLTFPDGYVIGESPAMASLYRELRDALDSDLPVLVAGETGAGKELVVRILHDSSPRGKEPLVSVNCAAIPADLLEAEMFGIGEGVATGVRQRAGKFARAEGGTLFLDEIADMPLELQAKLLRALEEGKIEPVGGTPRPIDVRVVAASNVDLSGRVEDGRFRRDLYYRIAGWVLRVPPLRERRSDQPALIEHFLRAAAGKSGKAIRGLTSKALSDLTRCSWPGNVRELEHEVTRLVHQCSDGGVIDSTLLSRPADGEAGDLPAALPASGSLRLRDHVEAVERRVILAALERAGGSQRQAARLLEISRNALARKIDRLGIRL